MPNATDLFTDRICWMSFKNQSGQQVPPFSCVMATGWQTPDPGQGGIQSPYLLCIQPDGTGAPFNHWITGPVATPPNSLGTCARPDQTPLLAQIAGGSSGASDTFGRLVGPQSGQWSLTRDAPGFVMLGLPQSGYVLVAASKGPYRGQIQTSISVGSSGSVYTVTGPKANEQASQIQVPQVYNPYATISGTASRPTRVTFDWVGDNNGSYELIAANPCSQ